MATDLTESMLKELSTLEREEGILRLSSCFQWREFEGDDQRQYLHQEFVYESVMYSVKRGLPWSAVAQIANMTKELLPELKGHPLLTQAVSCTHTACIIVKSIAHGMGCSGAFTHKPQMKYIASA
uniref:Uncharacterized protein n=1 Tax=Pygocentrus nattereri TaxID=42514 RepID=A0A3B4E9M9_PYGNA